MKRYFLTTIALLPLLLSPSHACQNYQNCTYMVDPPTVFGYSSEESPTSAYLGVDITDVTTERLSALQLKEEKGVEVTMVDQDAPAGKAGLKVHDVILSMNNASVDSAAQLRRMIHETPAGRLVTLGISRDGQPMTIKLQLADRRKEFPHVSNFDPHVEIPPIPNMPDFEFPEMNVVVVHSSARSGLTVENLTPQLGEFLGVKNGNGVLIRSVEKGSRGEKAGFRAGDVIVKVNDQTVHDTSDFTHALRYGKGGSVNVNVIREKKEQNLNLSLPEHKESGDLNEEEGLDETPVVEAESDEIAIEAPEVYAEVRPQIALAVEDARKAAEEYRTELCDQQKQLREQMRELRKELGPKIQKQLQQGQRQLKKQMEQLRLEMRHSFDI